MDTIILILLTASVISLIVALIHGAMEITFISLIASFVFFLIAMGASFGKTTVERHTKFFKEVTPYRVVVSLALQEEAVFTNAYAVKNADNILEYVITREHNAFGMVLSTKRELTFKHEETK